jgi:2-iminobutanoate/2-iminopropanoate deaminase
MGRRTTYHIQGVHHAAPIPYGARVGNTIYSSAIQGINAQTGELSDDLAEQTKHCFQNLRSLLAVAGASTGDIVRMTCLLKDLNDREALNSEWLAMFPDENDRPARHTSSYNPPPGGMKIQIEIVAIVDD